MPLRSREAGSIQSHGPVPIAQDAPERRQLRVNRRPRLVALEQVAGERLHVLEVVEVLETPARATPGIDELKKLTEKVGK
jgi:hypothetical protein